jgi:DNA phosphorothioation-dependent restriction protein DptH
MSKHFYNYLTLQIETFFKNSVIQPGDKYHIQFERPEQVEWLINELKTLNNFEKFKYITPNGSYESFCLYVNGVRILIASTTEATTPDFLTTLRNKVGSQEVPFNDKAMLLVHNSNLDSLVHGMTSFAKEGMPFNLRSIEYDLNLMMGNLQFSNTEKSILDFILSKKKEEQTYQEQITLFDYEDILKVLSDQKLDVDNFIEFGLFYDTELLTFSFGEREIKERLNENFTFFEKVDTFHKNGNYEQELEKLFDSQGVQKLSGPEWNKLDFSFVRKSNQKKLEDKDLEYSESNKKITLEGFRYWDRADGESKTSQRKRNIIIFNSEGAQTITLELSFSDYINKKYISGARKNQKCTFDSAGRKIRLNIQFDKGETNFYAIKYKTETSSLFEFKIAVVECSDDFLSTYQTSFTVNTIKSPHILLHSDEDKWVFNSNQSESIECQLKGDIDLDRFEIKADQELILTKSIISINEDELLRFQLSMPHTNVPLAIQDVIERPVQIGGFNVWKLKREKQEHFKYRIENDKLKILQGSRENYTQGEFKKNLERELEMVSSGSLFYYEQLDGIHPEDISVTDSMQRAYDNIIQFFRANKLLPSLAYFDEEYTQLATAYVNIYINELEGLKHGQSLNKIQRDLVLIGTIQRQFGDKEWLFTPLHPLNIAYQLQLNQSLGSEIVNDELLKILRSTNLVPFITYQSGKVYKPIEQSDSLEWALYVDRNILRYEGTRSFINKLVHEKIREFTQHFGYLFSVDRRSSLKISVINMGDCQEILQGLFEYYKLQLRNKISKFDLLPIDLYIYAGQGMNNVFEELSQYSDVEEISNKFGLKIELDGYIPEELLNIFRDQVRFYSKNIDSLEYEYSHITFYQMSEIEQVATSSMSEIITGLSLFGLIAGVPSVFINGDYKTGFGTKFYHNSNSLLLSMLPKLNSLLRVARSLDIYQEDTNIVTAISINHKTMINKVYDSTHWVTFVEPKVDLSFFKNDITQKDLLVIHYSDQYTSSSGFDAITVTRRSAQYQHLITEFLKSQKVVVQTETVPQIINFFNAVNGNWLLRLLAQNNHFPKEKISILSAVKLVLAVFSHPNIIWIPISMEEVLRISGGTGLKQSEGLFSAKNLGGIGSYSDDLLLIGIEKNNDQLEVYFYPVEVKIGNNLSAVKEKAVKQVKETRKLIFEYLQEEDSFRSKIYRNFFIQLAISSAEKLKLYDIWPEQVWDTVINDITRERLLNDQYKITNKLDQYIGQGAVVSFKKDIVFIESKKNEDVLVFDFPEKSGFDLIVTGIENLKQHIQSGHSDISNELLLANLYNQDKTNQPSPHMIYTDIGKKKLLKVSEAAAAALQPSPKPLEILFGNNLQNGQEIKWYPTTTSKVMHTNTGIIGTMGTGKTQFTKSLIAQLHGNSVDNIKSRPIGILIFDYKGDYIKQDFVSATGAKVYSLYHLPYNPLSLFVTQPPKPLLPLHTSNSLTDTISTAFNLGAVQKVTLKDLIMDAYTKKGIHKADSTTWERQAPTFDDVYSVFENKDGVKIDSLYAALKELYETEVFEPDSSKTISLFEMIDGVTIIDLSGYNESIQNLVVAITLDVFYNQMQMVGHSTIEGDFREITRMILVDEADNFLSKDFKSIKKILKEGREYGVGTILSTQFLSHFSTGDNEYANYILTWIVHNVSEMSAKDIRMIFNTQSKAEEENIMNRIKSLEKHQSIVKGVSPQPVWIRDKAFWELD